MGFTRVNLPSRIQWIGVLMEGLLNIKIDIKLEIVPNVATKQIMTPEIAKTQEA